MILKKIEDIFESKMVVFVKYIITGVPFVPLI